MTYKRIAIFIIGMMLTAIISIFLNSTFNIQPYIPMVCGGVATGMITGLL
jgi:hypothetical protein